MMRRAVLVLRFSVRKISASLGFSADDDFSLPLDSGSSPALGSPSEAAALLCSVQIGSKRGDRQSKNTTFIDTANASPDPTKGGSFRQKTELAHPVQLS